MKDFTFLSGKCFDESETGNRLTTLKKDVEWELEKFMGNR